MQIKLNVDFQVALRAIKRWRHQSRGEGVPKISDKKWERTNSDITTKKMYKFKKNLVLLMNSCIFLVFKYTFGSRLVTGL